VKLSTVLAMIESLHDADDLDVTEQGLALDLHRRGKELRRDALTLIDHYVRRTAQKGTNE
jgi:hypothetical protein